MTTIKYDCDICKKVYHIETEHKQMTEEAQSHFVICDVDFNKGMVCEDCYKNSPVLAQEIDYYLESI